MLNFEIEIFFGETSIVLQVEEIDPWPDANGYLRYNIRLGELSSLIAFDTRYWIKPILLTPEDIDIYYEFIHYPDGPKFYSEDNIFRPDEMELIRLAIGKYVVKLPG